MENLSADTAELKIGDVVVTYTAEDRSPVYDAVCRVDLSHYEGDAAERNLSTCVARFSNFTLGPYRDQPWSLITVTPFMQDVWDDPPTAAGAPSVKETAQRLVNPIPRNALYAPLSTQVGLRCSWR